VSKNNKHKTTKSSKPQSSATTMAEKLEAAGITAKADELIAKIEPGAVPETSAEQPTEASRLAETINGKEGAAERGFAETTQVAATTTGEPEPELTTEQKEAIAATEAKIATAKAELAKARAELASLKKGPKGNAVDAEGNPLSAGKKAWLTRVARGFQPKPKAPKPPRDPNAPLTAGQKAQLTRAARKADPNYQPPKKATAKAPAKDRLDAAIGTAFPVESALAVQATA
jgi:hypothetical protein